MSSFEELDTLITSMQVDLYKLQSLRDDCLSKNRVKEAINKRFDTLMLDDYAIGSPRGEDYYIEQRNKLLAELGLEKEE